MKSNNRLLFLFIVINLAILPYGRGWWSNAVEYIAGLGCSGWLSVMFSGCVLLYCYVCKIKDKVHRSWMVNAIAIILLILCLYSLWLSGKTEVVALWLLALFAILFIVVGECMICKSKETAECEDNGILDHDIPTSEITSVRRKLGDAIMKRIFSDAQNNHDIERAFVFNIDGAYGTGKSSLILYMKKEFLEKSDKDGTAVYISFNPWKYGTQDKIIKAFFDILSSKLSRYFFIDLEMTIRRYVAAVINDSMAYGSLRTMVDDLMLRGETVEEMREKIISFMQSLKRPVVVFVDDVDRLNGQELWTIYYMIREVADFPYLYFIMASDYEYVVKTMNGELEGEDKAEEFIKKIINVNIPLPKYETGVIMKEVKAHLHGIIEKYYGSGDRAEKIEEDVLSSIKKLNHAYLFYDMREVKRFFSSLALSCSAYDAENFKTNLCFRDYFFLEIVKYNNPMLYKQLAENPLCFLKQENKVYFLKQDVEKIVRTKAEDEMEKELMSAILKREHDKMQNSRSENNNEGAELKNIEEKYVSRKNRNDYVVYRAVRSLFDNRDLTNRKSVKNIDSFDDYFAMDIGEGNISVSHFLSIFSEDDNKVLESRLKNEIAVKDEFNGMDKTDSFYNNLNIVVREDPEIVVGDIRKWLQRMFACVTCIECIRDKDRIIPNVNDSIFNIFKYRLDNTVYSLLLEHRSKAMIDYLQETDEFLMCKLMVWTVGLRFLRNPEYSEMKESEINDVTKKIYRNVAEEVVKNKGCRNELFWPMVKACKEYSPDIWNDVFVERLKQDKDQAKYWALGLLMWNNQRKCFMIDDLFKEYVIPFNDIPQYIELLKRVDEENVQLVADAIAQSNNKTGEVLVEELPMLKEARYYKECHC